MGKHLLMIAFCVAAVFSSLAANTWYVDAVNGNDDWNGKTDFSQANPESKIGPKKTLSVFTKLVASGDTIYAAPGRYNELTSPNATSYRFYTSVGNISLVATGSATNTFIEGAADSSVSLASSPYGCGANAIVPVKMLGGDNLIKGFTITGGRQVAYDGSNYGGGAVFSSVTTDRMVDCVVTNCVAIRGGGVYHLGTALRCTFTGNYANEGAHGFYVATAVNCLFENTQSYAVYNGNEGGTILNCTFRGNKSGNYRTNGTGTSIISVYNSVFLKASDTPKNKGCDFYNCLFDYDPTVLASTSEPIVGTNGTCRVVATGKAKVNADGSPMAGSPLLDAADSDLYTSHFPAAFDSSERDYDLYRQARSTGANLDLGAIERQEDTIDDTEWFVDALNGNDANTGKTPQTAKQSLAAAMEGRVSGETVHAAAGVYSNKTMTVGSRLYRVTIPAGVRLVGTQGAEKTVILGARSSTPDGTYGTGPGAISCVYAYESDSAATWVTLKGFTLANGTAAAKTGDGDGYGAALRGKSRIAGIMTDCVVTNCVAARGPVYYFGHVVRCRFYDNVSVEGAGCSVFETASVYDSYFRNSISGVIDAPFHDIYQNASLAGGGGIVVNCTFESTGYGGPHAAGGNYIQVYNSLMRCGSDGGGASYHNCVNGASLDTAAQKNSEKDDATIITNLAGIVLTEETRRPVRGFNVAVGKGDFVTYTNLLPTVLKDIVGKDVWGNPRLVDGVLDVGAAACDRPAARVTDASTGLTVTGVPVDGLWHDVAAGGAYTLTRNYTSRLLLKGVCVNGTYVDFNAHEDGWSYAGTFAAGTSLDIACVYPPVNDWYVDKANGDDANDGLRPGAGHAFASLARASTNALMEAGATVYVAEGVYDSGIVPAFPNVDATDSRMYVPYEVSFVATGRRSETVVVGASSSETASGIGAGAVRCCLMRGGSVRGFTMRGGNVSVGAKTDSDQGGGIRCTSDAAYAYDCEIYNCNAVRGGGARGVRLVRCYLHDNTITTTGVTPTRSATAREAYQCSGYNSVIKGDCYLGTRYLNCTILGNCWGIGTVFLNCYLNGDGAGSTAVAAAFTNCVVAGAIKPHSQQSACVTNSPCAFDGNFRAKSRHASVIGSADKSRYAAEFPSDLAAYADLDFAGGARTRNECTIGSRFLGALDVGAGERDVPFLGLMFTVR